MPPKKLAYKGAGAQEDFEKAKVKIASENLIEVAKKKLERLNDEIASAVQDKHAMEMFNSLFSKGDFKEAARILKTSKLYNDSSSAHRHFVRYGSIIGYNADDIKRVSNLITSARDVPVIEETGLGTGFRAPYAAEISALEEMEYALEIDPSLKETTEYKQLLQVLPGFVDKAVAAKARKLTKLMMNDIKNRQEGGNKKKRKAQSKATRNTTAK